MPKEDYLYQTINKYNIVAQAFIYLCFPFLSAQCFYYQSCP